tara:strand:- start:1120 stop:1512 length:393 start_codon:yes stop_codon:yes gene_type:complete
MKKILFTAFIALFFTVGYTYADIRGQYNCKSTGYIEMNHEGRVKNIELENFTLGFEGHEMVVKGGFSWFLSSRFPYKISADLSIISGSKLGVTFVFEKDQLTIAAIYPSTWSETTHMRGMTVLQAKCEGI